MSNYPDITQDISFWIEYEDVEEIYNERFFKVEYKWKYVNEFFEMIRDDNFIEEVKLLDTHKNSITNLVSNTYRLYFKPISEVQKLSLVNFKNIKDKLTEKFNVRLR